MTFLNEDRPWAQVDGWSIYATNHLGCFAKKVLPAFALVFGRVKGSGDFIVGMTGRAANLPNTGDRTMTLVFDGARRRQPYFETRKDLVIGRFAANAGLVQEIAKSTRLQVFREKTQIADFPLEGTRAALSAASECLKLVETRETEFQDSQEQEFLSLSERLCEDKPSNGQLLIRRRGAKKQGHKVTIRNGGEGDAIIKIRDERSKKLSDSFFVHRNGEATINGVSDGEFRIQFAYGDTLRENCAEYANPRPSQFDKSVKFDTRVQRTGKKTTIYTHDFTATLYSVTGGNAPTSPINPDEFVQE